MKKTFTYRTEWSDQSEHSPQTVGQLPDYVHLPDGARVPLEPDERFERPSRSGYYQLHDQVRVRPSFWGDNGTSRMGRAGGKLEVLAPKGSTFLFVQRCPLCGEIAGEVDEDALDTFGRARPHWHPDCARIIQEMDN